MTPQSGPSPGLLGRGFGRIVLVLPKKNERQSSLHFLESVRTYSILLFNIVHNPDIRYDIPW